MKSIFASTSNHTRGANRSIAAILGLLWLSCALSAFGQVNVLTQHNDNLRTGTNVNETLLTPANVNASTFGALYSLPVDGLVAAQPLYVSGLNIPGMGVHNVVFVETLHDSVYAFDADSASTTPLWSVNFTNPAAGITTEPPAELGCIATTFNTEMGIIGTPTIDTASGTMYLVAKTKESGTYHFHLHALDITTGLEKFAGPVDLSATVVGKAGTLQFITAGKNMMARPGLLLSQGIVYMAFGSNGCDGGGTRGWVLAYDASTLMQLGVFNATPDSSLARGNIWMAGSGLASDGNGNVFFSTANGPFDANLGNNDYGTSVLKIGLGANGLAVRDYFTPYNQANLTFYDLDLASAGVTLFPDQPGAHPHMMVASGKEGSVYLIDRDNMGQFNPTDNSRIVQFMPNEVGRMFSTAAYWNGNVFFTGQTSGASAYSLSTGQLSLLGRSATVMGTPHTPSISANGSSNGLLWVANASTLDVFDATNIVKKVLYTNGALGTMAHFNTPTIANGKVYIGSTGNLQVLGLLGSLQPASGDGQATTVLSTFPVPLQVAAADAYKVQPVAGVTVTFSDGGKGGTFNPVSAVTDASGLAATSYSAGKTAGNYTITVKSPTLRTGTFSLTVTPGPATRIQVVSGNNQTAPVQTTYAAPFVVRPLDVNLNPVPGMTMTFSDGGKGGTFSANPVVSDASGRAQTFYTPGTKATTRLIFTVTSGSLKIGMTGAVTAGPAAGISVVSGNNQTGAISTTLATPLTVLVVDQFNNVVLGASVSFNDGGRGGAFSANPVVTDATGKASASYTLPPASGIVNISASISGGATANFTETAQ